MVIRSTTGPVVTGSYTGGRSRLAGRPDRPRLLVALGVGSLLMLGCTAQTPKCETRSENHDLCVTPEDFGVPSVALSGYGRKTLEPQPSTGRFPSGVSVVRVAAMAGTDGAQRCLRVADTSTEETVYWMHIWDDLPQIREVTRLRTLGLDPRGATYEDLLRESVNINCELCVMYARVEETEADAEYVAVLWDAMNRKPLASFRIPAALPDETREKCAKAPNGGRAATREAEFLALADLRKSVRDTMWDLVHGDQASPTTQPNPWTEYDYLPVFLRDYGRWQRVFDLQRQKQPPNDK